MSCFSSSTNPGQDPNNDTNIKPSDREEPDLVAHGGDSLPCVTPDEGACVASYDPSNPDPKAWRGWQGTSFSAPVVTSLVTLFRQRCEHQLGGRIDERWMRAMIRNRAYGANPDGPAYSTPRPLELGLDFKDGAGFLYADALLACPERGDGGPLLVDLEAGGPLPNGPSPYQDGYAPPGETQGLSQPQSFDYAPGPGSDRDGLQLGSWSLTSGRRIRATLSFDGCTPVMQGEAPVAVAGRQACVSATRAGRIAARALLHRRGSSWQPACGSSPCPRSAEGLGAAWIRSSTTAGKAHCNALPGNSAQRARDHTTPRAAVGVRLTSTQSRSWVCAWTTRLPAAATAR